MRRWLLAAGCLAAFLAFPGAAPASDESLVGKLAPPFTLTDLSGKKIALQSYRGKSVVQIVGWAAWCHGCRMEIPRLKEAYQKYHGSGFEILALTGPYGQDLEKVKSFTREFSLPYPVLFDSGTKVLEMYRINSVPANLILDLEGRVVYEGAQLPEDYERRIEKLLSQRRSG